MLKCSLVLYLRINLTSSYETHKQAEEALMSEHTHGPTRISRQHLVLRWILSYMMEQVNPQQSFSSISPVFEINGTDVCWDLDAIFRSCEAPE